tara:strand:+ start:2169 stop:4748 length:2580 start_codon:yes stop_codon:yes gene_type:complete
MAITRAQQAKQMLRDGGVTEDIGFSIVKPSKDGRRPGYRFGDERDEAGFDAGRNQDNFGGGGGEGENNPFERQAKQRAAKVAADQKAARDRENARIVEQQKKISKEQIKKAKEFKAKQKRQREAAERINKTKTFKNFLGNFNPFPITTAIAKKISNSKFAQMNNAMQRQNYLDYLSRTDPEAFQELAKELVDQNLATADMLASDASITSPSQRFGATDFTSKSLNVNKDIFGGQEVKDVLGTGYTDYLDRFNTKDTGGGDDGGIIPVLPKKVVDPTDDGDDTTTPTRNFGGLAPRFAGSIFDFTGLADGGRAGAMDGGIMRLGLKDGDLAYDASDASIFGSSAISVTPETTMDGFGNQVQKEMGNTFNPPLIEDVIQEKSVIEDTNKQGIMQNENIDSIMQGFKESEFGKNANSMQQDAVNFKYDGKDMTMNSSMAGAFEQYLDSIGKGDLFQRDAPQTGLVPITGKTAPKDLMSGFQSFLQESGALNRPMTADMTSYRLPDGTVQEGSSTMRGLMNQYLKSIGQSPTTDVFASRVNVNQGEYNPSPLMRAAAADGGMMSPVGGIMDLESGRQMYFLGKLVKKATRAVKKVVKSPIGKAALLYFGGGALGNLAGGSGLGGMFRGAMTPSKFLARSKLSNIFTKGGLKNIAFGKAAGAGYAMPGQGIFRPGTSGILGSSGKLSLGKALGLGLGLPAALDLMGVGKEEDEPMDLGPGIDIRAIRNSPYRYLAPRFTGSNYEFADGGRIGYAEGSKEPVAKKTMPLLDMDGMEKDYREDGGFVPIGRMERADDVPARLSKNEFVFTADAVRNAGDGDIDKGAEVMYNMMKNLESGGEVSEESQGLDGAKEMFQTSKRLEEVL